MIALRALGDDAVDEIAALEARAHGAWSRRDVQAELARDDAVVVGAFLEGGLAGFAVVRRGVDDAELLEIAVDPAARRRGVGRALLDEAARVARGWGAARLLLEVRAGNAAARALYARAGFVEDGARRGYYRPQAPGQAPEDAVLMALGL